jgi:glycolate oxidase FAD binding subunit
MPLFFDPVDLDAQERVRDAFDPDHLFNPGKVLPAASGYVVPKPISVLPAVANLLGPFATEPPPGAPDSEYVVAPTNLGEVAEILRTATAAGLVVTPWGGGSHQGYGGAVVPDIVLVTRHLDRIVEWRPEDLVVVAEAGVRVADLEDRLLVGRGQTAVLPERPGAATVGGCVAAAASGWRRLRFGPTRNRVLETTLCTGDGRVVRSGARVVKNATGYDLARLATGSLGSLGVIGRVALRLWPHPKASATVAVADPEEALHTVHRPWAVVESDGAARVFLAGTRADVEADAEALGGDTSEGHQWPEAIDNRVRFRLRVPAADTRRAVQRLPAATTYRAGFGVGEVEVGCDSVEGIDIAGLRAWAEARGGGVAVTAGWSALDGCIDPWGAPPPSLPIQRRIKAAFDPAGIMVPGRLAGGL